MDSFSNLPKVASFTSLGRNLIKRYVDNYSAQSIRYSELHDIKPPTQKWATNSGNLFREDDDGKQEVANSDYIPFVQSFFTCVLLSSKARRQLLTKVVYTGQHSPRVCTDRGTRWRMAPSGLGCGMARVILQVFNFHLVRAYETQYIFLATRLQLCLVKY